MQADRFFQSTRGKIVAELRRRHAASAVELAQNFGLSPNAIRQHLGTLEREGLVLERPVRRGPTKPTYEFSLTAQAEKLFPQQYDRMLGAVLREVRDQAGPEGVGKIFAGIGKRAVSKANARVTSLTPEGKLSELTEILRENGVAADYTLIDGGFELHEHNCPYATVVRDHPEVCSVIHQVLDGVIGGEHVQTESLATGGAECRFELKVAK
ncbi:MAG: HTH domain-containing protein [Vulcanimicrobiaceae bacterium]